MATFGDIRRNLLSQQQREQSAQQQGQSPFEIIRQRLLQPPPEPVETVVRRSPQLNEVLAQRGLRQREQLTMPDNVLPSQTIRQELERRAQEAPPAPPSPARGQRLIDAPANFIEGAFDSIGLGTLGAAQRQINRFLTNQGLMTPQEAQEIEANRQARQETGAYKVGQIAGYLPPAGVIERGVTTVARPLIQNMPRAGRLATTGAAAGAVESAVQELGDVAFRGETFDSANILIGTGAGGVAGAATPLIERGVRRLVQAIRPQQAASTQLNPLALPEPRPRGNVNRAQTPDIINVPESGPRGLPEPNLAPPTRARIGRQVNPYRQRFEEFVEQMRGVPMPPGREWEAYQDAWSRFARPDEPGLEEMIELAYPTRPNRITPDLVQRARETQRKREVYGVGMPVRSLADRYQGGVVGSAAAPIPTVGRRAAVAGQQAPTRRVVDAERISPQDSNIQPLRGEPIEGQASTVRTAQEVSQRPQTANVADDLPKDLFPETTPAESVRQGWFERLFGSQSIGIIPQLRRGGRNPLTTEGQIVDSPIRSHLQGASETARAAVRSVYHDFVDMNDPLKKISRKAYEASMDANRANQLANVIVTDKFVTPEGQVVGEGLRNIIRKVGRGNYNRFTDYLILRHARTRMARGEKVYDDSLNMTPEKVQERIDFYESRFPQFRQIGEEWDNYFRNLRNIYGVDGDLIPRSLAETLERENPHYAPMRRQFTTAEKIKGVNRYGQSSMFSGQKAPIKEVSPTGSARKIVDPVRSAIEQTGAWVNAVMRNRVMKEIVNKIIEDPENMRGIAEIVQPPKGQPELRELLLREGEEGLLERLQADFDNLFKRGKVDGDNIVRAMIQGEPVYIKVHDPEAVKALVGMGAEQANFVLSFLSAFSKAIKQGATGVFAPLFAVRGATMDIGQALIQAENKAQHLAYLGGALLSAIADAFRIPVLRNMARNYYRAGGGYSAALRSERGLRRSISDMRLDPLLSPRTIAKGIGRTIAAPYKAALALADISENMNRIAAYNYKLRQLGEPTPENVRQAMNYAREITTNYSRRGRHSRTAEALFPYHNAAIQGLYRFAKAWKENPVKTAAMVSLTILAPKLYEYARFHEDEDYNNLPARERYRFIFVNKNADGTFTKIAVPPEYGAIGAFLVDTLRAYKDGDPDGFKGVSDALMNAFTPPTVSGAAQGFTQGGGLEQSFWGLMNQTSFGPLVGAAANQAFYGGPVEPLRLSDRSPSQRYDERTSSVAKQLGEQLNLSPKKIDYILRAYGGDPARLLLPLTSEVGAGTTRNTLLRNFITDPVFTNTITDDYYRGRELLNQAYRDYKETGKELPEWYNEGLRRFVTSTAKGSVSNRISTLYERKRRVELDPLLTNEERAQRLRDIQRQINEIMIDVNTRMKEAGVPILNR